MVGERDGTTTIINAQKSLTGLAIANFRGNRGGITGSVIRFFTDQTVLPAMSEPIVNTVQGPVRGKVSKNHDGIPFYSFQGIPYAKAPVGELRFCDPKPPEPWKGILDGTKEGPECPSTNMLLPYYVGREDNCLNLNIYSKTLPSNEANLHPVMVFIHGGAFVIGSNKTDMYGPEFLLMEDVVLVTINYRLGPLGFLCLEDSSLGVPGNAGLKDQVMALRWVKKNIKYFNGDPDNVTIFGESAGAASVHYLVLSPLAKGLFHKAVMQSGVALNPWARGVRGAKELCRRLRYKETDERKILEYLRKLSTYTLTNARFKSRDGFRAGEQRFYGPVIEDPSPEAFISDSPENIIKSGKYNKVPMIIGYANKEGLLFELVRKLLPYAEYPINNFMKEIDFGLKIPEDDVLRNDLANKVKNFYFGSDQNKTDDAAIVTQLKTDTQFMYGITRAARLHLKTCPEQPIFVYEMTLDAERNMCKKLYTAEWIKTRAFLLFLAVRTGSDSLIGSGLRSLMNRLPSSGFDGAAHGDDLMYLFNSPFAGPLEPNTKEEKAVRKFVKMWTSFARCGNPTPSSEEIFDNVIWKPLDDDFTYIDIGEKLQIKTEPNKERVKFWDEIYDHFQP